MDKIFEIGIIGAGPAGSTAAAYLAGYGFDVCLFEKKSFPRETLCGEFLSDEVIQLLKELNLFNEFISLNPNKITSFLFFDSSGKSVGSKFNFDAYGLSRSLFDNLLLCNAKNKGVTVYQPSEVKKIIRLRDSYELIIEAEGQNQKSFYCMSLISAYGKQNSLDNLLNREFVAYRSKLNGVKFHLSKNELNDFNHEEIHIYTADNLYCGVNSVDNNKVTFCFLENRNYEQPPPRKQLIELQKKNKAFKKIFNTSNENFFDSIPVFGTGNIYFGRRKLIENGIFMIGDSSGIIAPLAGDGIGIAMESGKLIADLYLKRKKERLTHDQISYLYEKEWNKLFLNRIKKAKIIQNLIINRYGREAGFRLVKIFPALLPYLIKSTRNTSSKKI